MKHFQPTNAIAVVTGGASGIGRALCEALLRKGARTVVVADLNQEATNRVAAELGDRAIPAALDVADPAAVRALVEKIEVEQGPIDLWCSNAGINVGKGLGELVDWQRALSVNVMGHVHAAQAVIPGMKKRGGGCFVVTSSAAGLLSDFRTATYTASKHAAV